jgi:hypothetical protein
VGEAAERERNRIHDQVAEQQDLFLRQVDERVAGRDASPVVQDLDVPFAQLDRQPIREGDVGQHQAHVLLLLEEIPIRVQQRFQVR